jgi:GAF domain-containing protein
MTQAELEAHPEWKGFGTEADKHPPMRGWLAAPIVGEDGTNWGLLQLSDKCEGEFTEEDEKYFISFAKLVSETLEALWNVRNLRKVAEG